MSQLHGGGVVWLDWSDQEGRQPVSGLGHGHGWSINTSKLCLHTHTDTDTHTHRLYMLDPSCQPWALWGLCILRRGQWHTLFFNTLIKISAHASLDINCRQLSSSAWRPLWCWLYYVLEFTVWDPSVCLSGLIMCSMYNWQTIIEDYFDKKKCKHF